MPTNQRKTRCHKNQKQTLSSSLPWWQQCQWGEENTRGTELRTQLCCQSCPLTDTRGARLKTFHRAAKGVLLTDHLAALCCICYPSLIRGLCQSLQFCFNVKSDTSKHLNYSAHNYRGWYGDFITVWKGIVIAGATSLVFKIILIWATVKYIE